MSEKSELINLLETIFALQDEYEISGDLEYDIEIANTIILKLARK